MNLGAPAWSDKYGCAEWPWFNGIVDAMAFGNHDADYGPDAFAECQSKIDYPILSANTLDADGQPLFQADGKIYKVFELSGVKIGVFALAGPDFDRLIRPAQRPAAGATFADRTAAARQIVAALRDAEKVNAVVLIGHALREDDIALAQAVPGIDIIFGTHSHRKEDLFKIPGTSTWMLSPFQYATYVSKLDLQFSDGALSAVSGGLVRMDAGLQPEPRITALVEPMQADLQADPRYAALFQPIGAAAVELSTDGQFTGEAVLGNFVMDIFRSAAQSNMALATASGFREPIPPGTLLEEGFRASMPYKNGVLVYTLTGAQIQALLDLSVSRSGSDFFSQVSGVRFTILNGQAANIQILKQPSDPAAGFAPLDRAATYTVATTDFQGKLAGGYKDIFSQASFRDTGIADIRDVLRDYLKANSPVHAALDGRITSGQLPVETPAQLPNTGGGIEAALAVALLGACLVGLGWRVRRSGQASVGSRQ
jgi:5'-nucleotidase